MHAGANPFSPRRACLPSNTVWRGSAVRAKQIAMGRICKVAPGGASTCRTRRSERCPAALSFSAAGFCSPVRAGRGRCHASGARCKGGCSAKAVAPRAAQGFPSVTHVHVGAPAGRCPHCGLVLTVRQVEGGTRLSYDMWEWQRLCKQMALDSPVLCLLKRRGNGQPTPNDPAVRHC